MRRLLSLTVGLAATATALLPGPALAAPPRSHGPEVQAVLTLAARPGARDAVAAFAHRHGLRVVDDGPGFVVVQGAARTAASSFGTVPDGHPRVPAVLASAVRSVAGLDTRPLFHPALAGLTGTDLGAAYDLPAGTGGAGITVATVQFSGWTPSDLTTYASTAGIPLAPGQVTTFPVAGASPTTSFDGGDVEVALDTEAILAVAPRAKQRVYVTTNSTAGAVAAYQQIAADARAGLVQVVSESWGSCETDTGADDMSAMTSALSGILAAGATFFASTGDTGPYSCFVGDTPDTSLPDVSFPASLPSVVAVGGTRLTGSGTSWSETAWPDSGGGQSRFFARPAYQSGLPVAGANRLVPDVAAEADEATGMAVYAASQGWVTAGGTSLAAPVWAASLGVALSSAGRTTGVGDIHQALYANPSAFRDVTTGSNALFTAGPGYDELTGLGAPQWSRLAPALVGPAVPSTPPSGDTTPTAPQPRSTALACPAGQVPPDTFGDVPSTDPHAPNIACVAWWGIAKGTTTTTYRPTRAVTRGQMAAFVSRLLERTGATLPAVAPGRFGDVTASTPFADEIDALAAAGIVQGGTDGDFHPLLPVTRGQMATFLANAYAYRTGQALQTGTTTLTDVAGDVHASDIGAVVIAGIAGGYTDGTYRPSVAVPREQMATFVARLVDLLVSQGFGTPPAS